MILNCNSCGKKFVVPDDAISASGRTVQCGSCGNKWKQFPTNEEKKTQSTSSSQKIASKPQPISEKKQKPKKIKKTKRGPALSANSVYTKVGTFLLHKRVQRITPVHSCTPGFPPL